MKISLSSCYKIVPNSLNACYGRFKGVVGGTVSFQMWNNKIKKLYEIFFFE